jgi:hypothetical protein
LQGHVCNAILFFSLTFVVVSLPVSFGIPTSFDSVVDSVDKNDKNGVDAVPSNHERVEVEGVWQIVLVVFMVRNVSFPSFYLAPRHSA